MKLKRVFLTRCGYAAASFAVLEVAVRLSGAVDFPLYLSNNEIGYSLAPNQSGSFLNKNDWDFNELSMGIDKPFQAGASESILLIGDSIVLGGNAVAKYDRLGPKLSAVTGLDVWPISAGSWGLQNELTWLNAHWDVVEGVDHLIFVLNSGDLGAPSSWKSELTHPRRRPIFAVWYMLQKYVIRPRLPASLAPNTPRELLVYPVDSVELFAQFAEKYGEPLDVWLYPSKPQFLRGGVRATEIIEMVNSLAGDGRNPNVRLHVVEGDVEWSADLYRDIIHPTVEGNQILAEMIGANIQ
jgi:hypothetical protein